MPTPSHGPGFGFDVGQQASAHTASLQSLGQGRVCQGRGSNKGGHAESRQCCSPRSPLAEGVYLWIWDGGLLGPSPRGTQPDGRHRRLPGWTRATNWLARGLTRTLTPCLMVLALKGNQGIQCLAESQLPTPNGRRGPSGTIPFRRAAQGGVPGVQMVGHRQEALSEGMEDCTGLHGWQRHG
jgi:hypothetical protein